MAKQIKFYSVAAGATKSDANGVYFEGSDTTAELYKGTTRFGAPRVSTTKPSTGMIRGDMYVNTDTHIAEVYTGSKWETIGADYADLLSGLVFPAVDGSKTPPTTVITSITQEDDGSVDAHTSPLYSAWISAFNGWYSEAGGGRPSVAGTTGWEFEADVFNGGSVEAVNLYQNGTAIYASASTASGSNNGVKVSVSTKSGQVTAVAVTAPAYNATASTSYSLKNGIKVTVSTVNGQVNAVIVSNPFISSASTATSTSNDHTVTVSTVNGQVKAIVVAAPTKFTVDDIPNGQSTTTSYGMTISASTVKGSLTRADVIVKPITAGTGMASTLSIPTGQAVVEYVTSQINNLGTVMHFKGAGTSLPASPELGDVYVFTADSGTYKKGQEVVRTSTGWEILGDQNQWVDKVTGGTSTSTNNNVTVTVSTDAVTAKPTVVVTAPAYNPAEATKASTNNDHTVSVTTKDGQVTSVFVAAPSRFTVGEIGSSSLTSTVNDHTITVATTNGKLSSLVLAAPTRFAVSEIGNGASTSTSNGVTVSVSTKNGKLDKVLVAAPAYNAAASTASSTNNGHTVTVSTLNGQVTAVAVTAPAKFTVSDIGSAKLTSTSNGHEVTVSTVNGKINALVVAAPSRFTVSEIGSSKLTSTSNGHEVTVSTVNGKVTALVVAAPETAAVSTKTSTSNGV